MSATQDTQTSSELPQATIFLSPEALTATTVEALLPLHGRIRFKRQVSGDFKFRIQVDDQYLDFTLPATSACIEEDGSCFFDYQFVLNTFAFKPGEHRLLLSLPGTKSQPLQHTITVGNTSELGQQTSAAVNAHSASQWVWQEGEIDSSHFPIADERLKPWFDQDDAPLVLPEKAAQAGLDTEETNALQDFIEQGFCVLPQRLDNELINRLNSDLDEMLAAGEIDLREDGDHRVEQIHRKSAAAHEVWTLPPVIKFLRAVFQEDVLPCQTLVFLRGSGQDVHQDTIHLTAFPAGYMCGVWIALEDIDEESGPLFVHPGSHRLPRLYTHTVGMQKVHDGDWSEFARTFLPRLHKDLELAGCAKQTYLPRRGDILVWHENLAHGGSHRLKPGLSRRSIVSHYFSKGAAVWYDSTGRSSGVLQTSGVSAANPLSALQIGHRVLRGDVSLRTLQSLVRNRLAATRFRKSRNG